MNNMKPTIVVDAGKNSVKSLFFDPVKGKIKTIMFPSLYRKVFNFSDATDTDENGQFPIKINGEHYLVGTIDASYDFSNTKANEPTFIKIIAAVGYWQKRMQREELQFDLVVGLPSSEYSNKNAKFKMKEMLEGISGEVLEYGSDAFMPNIDKISIMPEGTGLMTRSFEHAKFNNHKQILVIDIGGYNINLRLYELKDKIYTAIKSKSIDEAGCNQIQQMVKNSLKKQIKEIDKVDLDSMDLSGYIENGNLEKLRRYLGWNSETEEKRFLDITIGGFLENKVLASSAEFALDKVNDKKILLQGGGAEMLQSYFNAILGDNSEEAVLSINPVWENPYSMLMFHIQNYADVSTLKLIVDTARKQRVQQRENGTCRRIG